MSRLDSFKIKMAEAGFDAAILSSVVNQRYMTEFDYTDGYVVITKNKSYVLADFRYIEAARNTVNANEYEIVMPEGSMLANVSAILDENECKTVAFEDLTLSVADLERMKKMLAGKELVIAPCRRTSPLQGCGRDGEDQESAGDHRCGICPHA